MGPISGSSTRNLFTLLLHLSKLCEMRVFLPNIFVCSCCRSLTDYFYYSNFSFFSAAFRKLIQDSIGKRTLKRYNEKRKRLTSACSQYKVKKTNVGLQTE